MKTFHFSDAGFDCKAVMQINTEEEVLRKAVVLAQDVQGVTVT